MGAISLAWIESHGQARQLRSAPYWSKSDFEKMKKAFSSKIINELNDILPIRSNRPFDLLRCQSGGVSPFRS